ncbi:MAG: universal stress protein [Lysobacter sp.]
MKILLAVDGSEHSTRAATFVVKLARGLASPPQIVLLHADIPLLHGVEVKLGAQGTRDYHADNSRYALKDARAALTDAGLEFDARAVVEDADKAIVEMAAKDAVDLVVMGSRGHSSLRGLLLGSTASKVIAHASVPVTVVR